MNVKELISYLQNRVNEDPSIGEAIVSLEVETSDSKYYISVVNGIYSSDEYFVLTSIEENDEKYRDKGEE